MYHFNSLKQSNIAYLPPKIGEGFGDFDMRYRAAPTRALRWRIFIINHRLLRLNRFMNTKHFRVIPSSARDLKQAKAAKFAARFLTSFEMTLKLLIPDS